MGTCCQATDPSLIPQPDPEMPNQNIIRLDPAFDCSGLTCVSYQGSAAFCTRECRTERDCPDGFDCRTVLLSDPGPGANIGPEDKFCVRSAHACTQ